MLHPKTPRARIDGYRAKSAEFPPKCFRITTNLFLCGVEVVASRCGHVSSHLFVFCFFVLFFFFLRCLVEMLVNAGQEMDSARDCKYKFSINLVMRKPAIEQMPWIILLVFSLFYCWAYLELSGISGCRLVYFGYIVSVCPSSSSLLLLLRRLPKTSKIQKPTLKKSDLILLLSIIVFGTFGHIFLYW